MNRTEKKRKVKRHSLQSTYDDSKDDANSNRLSKKRHKRQSLRTCGTKSENVEPKSSLAAASSFLLPPVLMTRILRDVDHDTLFTVMSLNSSWHHAICNDDILWRTKCYQHGWTKLACETPPGGSATWKQVYKARYQESCYDCLKPCSRKTLSFGKIQLRLCQKCSRMYAEPQLPHQRLISKTRAKGRWILSDVDLEQLPFAIEPNPINPLFAAMHLYRLRDVRKLSIEKFGSLHAVEEAWHKRLTRR